MGSRLRTRRGARFPSDPTKRGIRDPRGFIRGALDDELRSRGAHLDADKYEEALSYLSEVLCRLAGRYDPRRGSLSFTTFAYRILRRRYTSWLRESRGDSRYGYDGFEQAVANPANLRNGTSSEDATSFLALVASYDHDRLSPRARGTLRNIAFRMAAEGLTVTQAAEQLAKTRREASRDLDRLREELRA